VADIIDVEQGWDNNVVIVTLTGRKKVEGIGSNKGSSLLDWKRSVEANAKISLTPLEEKSLKASYQQRYNSLMNSINLLKQESSKKKKEVNIKFAQQIERQTQFMNKEQETYFSNLSTIKEKYSKLRKQIHAELLLIPDTFSTEKEKFCQDFAHKLIKLRKLREQKREDIVVSYYKNCVEYDDKLNKIQFEFKSLKNSVDKQYWSLEKTLSGIYEHLGQDRFFLSKTQEKIDFVRSINFTDYLKLILFLPNKLNKL
ncbi:MAG: hypothetical protein JNN15_15590, partial [Blastocatellia bacterium]|nr:hypothetical protein [Blastocatellia bacterium]